MEGSHDFPAANPEPAAAIDTRNDVKSDNAHEGEAAAGSTALPSRSIPSLERRSDEDHQHPLKRLIFSSTVSDNSTTQQHDKQGRATTTMTTINSHIRRHSDTTALLDLDTDDTATATAIDPKATSSAAGSGINATNNNADDHHNPKAQNNSINNSTAAPASTATTVKFADTPTTGRTRFDGKLARRRHSASGGSSSVSSSSSVLAGAAPVLPTAPVPPTTAPALPARGRVYRSSIATDKLTTRDIAALDFLLGIPLEAEETIVHHGWMLQQRRKLQSKQAGVEDASDDEDDADEDDDEFIRTPNKRRDIGGYDEVLLEPPNRSGAGWAHTSAAAAAAVGGGNNHNNNEILSHRGRWWEKWIPGDAIRKSQQAADLSRKGGRGGVGRNRRHHDDVELELPTALNSHNSNSDFMTSLAQQQQHHTGTPTTSYTHTTATGTPTQLSSSGTPINGNTGSQQTSGRPSKVGQHEPVAVPAPVYAPGRRLEGDEAVPVQIPLKVDTVTRQKSIARQAAIREWELKVAHGLGESSSQAAAKPPLLDGRLFFSAAGSYPMAVFSLKRYEPKREEAALRRQKLEARGGGGSHFVMPSRDWRGISYRALLPRKAEQARNQKAFNRFLRDSKIHTNKLSPSKKKQKRKKQQQKQKQKEDQSSSDDDDDDDDHDDNEKNNDGDDENCSTGNDDDDDDDSSSLSSSSSEDSYMPGILDDPEMTLGRHRNVMIGDCVTGCIVASTIQFVKPALLKADLNQKFRQRFDGWEPNKSQRKYIGARVVDGVYTLIDPTTTEDGTAPGREDDKKNHGSEDSSAQPAIIRMPPSLTLSKIRSVKRQALLAFVKANLEVGTVALACVYFERLCLSCRVDKTNRRLCFASCLLLASKINEPNEVLVMKEQDNATSGNESGTEDDGSSKVSNPRRKIKLLQSSIRPNKRSSSMFASLLEFFTQDWSLSLKHLFAAEWGVFAALRFSLHATPSQVAFHFKRLMKTLEWNPLHYLGADMYKQWGDALATEEKRRKERKRRREVRRLRKERRIQRELEKEVMRSKQMVETELLRKRSTKGSSNKPPPVPKQQQQQKPADSGNNASPISSSPAQDKNHRLPLSRASSVRLSPRRQDQSNNDSSQSETDNLLGRRKGIGRSQSTRSNGNNPRSSTSPKKERQMRDSQTSKKPGPIKLLHRLGMHRRPASDVKLNELASKEEGALEGGSEQDPSKPRATIGSLPASPSMPIIASQAQDTPDSQEQQQQHVAIDIPPDFDRGADDAGDKHDISGDGVVDEEMGENSSVNNGNAGLEI